MSYGLKAATAWSLGLAVFIAGPEASAASGVVEINQACVATGCFSGDGPGLPVEIDGSAGASYMLTSNLELPDENSKGISISADSISINLNGFAILGTTSCSGIPNVCAPVAGIFNGDGIVAEAPALGQPRKSGTRVYNGVVAKVGGQGLALGNSSHVENVRLVFNGRGGVATGTDSLVKDSVVHRNGFGIITGGGSEVSGCAITDNSSNGLNGGDAMTVHGNASSGNQRGLSVGTGGTLTHNSSTENRSMGINGGSGSSIIANVSYNNGDGGIGDDGITCDDGCNVRANVVRGNTGIGMRLGTNTGYSHNVISENGSDAVLGGVPLGDNYCTGPGTTSPLCP